MARRSYNDVLRVGVCLEMRPVARVKKKKKPTEHSRRRSPLKFCMRVRFRQIVIYFNFHENRLMGLGTVWVENRPLPLTWPMGYTTACTSRDQPYG